jgi:DNA primase
MLQDAGNDTSRKSEVVNKIAESLSKIDKAEDFTKQQDYIRQCSEILKIDELGLTNLVNKFKRDRVSKEDRKQPFEQNNFREQQTTTPLPEDATSTLLYHDEPQEKNILRVLMEYGLKPWDEEKSMAQHIFEELEEFHFDSPELEHLYETYKSLYEQGLHPTANTLLYHEDEKIRNLVISINMFPFELSPNWDTIMEGLNINNRDVSRQDVLMSVNYFKLRKIKRMFDENQRDIEKATSFEDQLNLIKVHKILKEEEQKITKQLGTVILK